MSAKCRVGATKTPDWPDTSLFGSLPPLRRKALNLELPTLSPRTIPLIERWQVCPTGGVLIEVDTVESMDKNHCIHGAVYVCGSNEKEGIGWWSVRYMFGLMWPWRNNRSPPAVRVTWTWTIFHYFLSFSFLHGELPPRPPDIRINKRCAGRFFSVDFAESTGRLPFSWLAGGGCMEVMAQHDPSKERNHKWHASRERFLENLVEAKK